MDVVMPVLDEADALLGVWRVCLVAMFRVLAFEVRRPLRDIDYWADARVVAHSVPGSRLSLTVERIEQALVGASP